MTAVINHVEQVAVIDVAENVAVIDVAETVAVVQAPASQGPSGPRGQPGPAGGSAVNRVAGVTLSALTVVYELPDGTVYPLDNLDEEHVDLLVGITLTSAPAAGEVTVQRTGPLDAAGLGLVPGRAWLGLDGRITQTPPETGFDILLGYATADQRIYLDPQPAITLDEE